MSLGSLFIVGSKSGLTKSFLTNALSYKRTSDGSLPWPQIIVGIPFTEPIPPHPPSHTPHSILTMSEEDLLSMHPNISTRRFSWSSFLDDPDSLEQAMRHCSYVFVPPSSHVDRVQHFKRVLEASATCSVEHVVMVSFLDAQIAEYEDGGDFAVGRAREVSQKTPMTWLGEFGRMEDLLEGICPGEHTDQTITTRLPQCCYTIIRCSPFMDLLLAFSAYIKSGLLPIPIGTARFAPVSVDDVSALACFILTQPDLHRDTTYDLTGIEVLSGDDMAHILTRVTGHMVQYRPFDLPSGELRRQMTRLGLSRDVIEAMESLFGMVALSARSGAMEWTTKGFMRDMMDRRQVDFGEFCARNVERFRYHVPEIDVVFEEEQDEELAVGIESVNLSKGGTVTASSKRQGAPAPMHSKKQPPVQMTPFLMRMKRILTQIPEEYHSHVHHLLDAVILELNDVARTESEVHERMQAMERDLHVFVASFDRGSTSVVERGAHVENTKTNREQWYYEYVEK